MDLYTLWENYTAASTRSAVNDFGLAPPPNPVNVGIDSARFLKLCKDGKLVGRNLRNQDIDVIFAKYAKQRRLNFGTFQDALVEVSVGVISSESFLSMYHFFEIDFNFS